jgi:nucleotide-binding universal stress UspA family protein
VSRDVPSDIARVARNKKVDLVLMGFHNPVLTRTILGGTVHRVLTGCDSDVAVFVDRGLSGLNQVLVPYLGGRHDVLAIQLAARMAVNSGASIKILSVKPLDASPIPDNPIAVAEAVSKLLIGKVSLEQVENDNPLDVVIEHAKSAQLIVIGVGEEWGLESQLFGMRPERIAESAAASLLIVRKCDARLSTKTT